EADTDTETTGVVYECTPQPLVTPATGFFVDVSDESGIRVNNFVPDPPQPIPINDHSRLGWADLNGDGYDDIVAHSLFPNPQAGIPFDHLVLINQGDGTFEDFSDASGLRSIQAGFFAFGDVDDDGDQDCYAGLDVDLPGEASQLLLNDGTGRFTAVAGSGVDAGNAANRAANGVFADFNHDARLDLFIASGQTSFGVRDQLFFGFGDGTFQDVSSVYLPTTYAQPGNGAVACDYDDDGDLDVFVSNYGVSNSNGLNQLWENDGEGHFANVAVERGFASLATGNYYLAVTGYGQDPEPDKAPGQYVGSNGFGLQCEDVDNDGDLDVYITAISHPVANDYLRTWSDPTLLLINGGAAAGYAFENEFLERGLPFNEGDIDGSMVDFDNDGRMDLAVSRDRKYEVNYDEIDQKAWFGLMHQQEDGAFASLGPVSGINDPDADYLQMKSAQNHAWSDYDHDGDLDLLIGGRDTGGGRPNFLFRNDVGHQNLWLAVRVVGDGEAVTRDAFGTRVTLRYPDRVVMRELKASRGTYNSMDSRALHFGLGAFGCDFTELEVRWPDGQVDTYAAGEVPVNHYITVRRDGALTVDE
ncbi:MAG: VCBS repeat-containing protein, partial [Myxococcales bacterium]|nr:VCBS repeat-containing protein [Myxococcales bacterium]